MSKHEAYLYDILDCTDRIEEYIGNMEFKNFIAALMVQDAVIRNLEVIGEAVKKLPDEVKNKKDHVQWRKIAGFRDVLIHDYANIDLEIVWDVIQNRLPELKKAVEEIISDSNI